MPEHEASGGLDWGLLEPLGRTAAELTSDDAVLAALVDVERALVRAWGSVRGEAPDAPDAVADALRVDGVDRARLVSGARSGGVPVISLVEQLREAAERAQPGSGWRVHVGATSQDVMDTALVLMARRTLLASRIHLVASGSSLARLAAAEVSTVSIARTLGQHAAQSTVGVAAAGWLDGVTAALTAIDSTAFPVQLGGAVGTGEDFDRLGGSPDTTDQLRAAVARELGLDNPKRSWHTERSPILEIAACAALVAVSLGRVGRDVAFLARTEIGEVSLSATGGSSAMPHKRNPVDAVLLTANGLRVGGLVATLYTAAVSQDARPAGEWHSEWAALRAVARMALESADAAAVMLAGLTIEHEAVDRVRAFSPDLMRNPEATVAASRRIVSAATRRFDACCFPAREKESL